MKTIPTKSENPKGLHQRYVVRKITGWTRHETMFGVEFTARTKAIDPKAEYFVLRVDLNGSDPKHIAACRKAVITYANEIKSHLPELSKDLIERYGDHAQFKEPVTDEEISDEAYEVHQDINPDTGQFIWKYAFDDDQAEAFITGAKAMRDGLIPSSGKDNTPLNSKYPSADEYEKNGRAT